MFNQNTLLLLRQGHTLDHASIELRGHPPASALRCLDYRCVSECPSSNYFSNISLYVCLFSTTAYYYSTLKLSPLSLSHNTLSCGATSQIQFVF